MPPKLITQDTIRELIASGKKELIVSKGTIVTPAALEAAAAHRIKIVESQRQASSTPMPPEPEPSSKPAQVEVAKEDRIVAFGSDHGGFQLKETLKKHAEALGYKVVDVGTHDEKPCDYPDLAYAVALAVSRGAAWRGVMIDGAGIGSCVVANKVPGVRAACCHNEFVAKNAREHNDTNVLTLGSRVTGTEVCKEIMRVWLETWFAGGRHKQRVNKIVDVEGRFLKT